MLRTTLRTGSAFVILAAAFGLVLAQNQNQPPAKSGTQALRAKTILGSKVQLQGNATAGTIEDIVFDSDGVIDYFVVNDGGKLVTVPWEAAKFNFEQRTAVINITQEQYRQVPTYTTERYPEFYTPTYQSQIYKFYNVTPGAERRFERRIRK